MVLGNFKIRAFHPVLAGVLVFFLASPAAARQSAADSRIRETVGRFNADAALDPGFAGILVGLLGIEYRTPASELRWARDRVEAGEDGEDQPGFGWGDVAVLAYLQAATGWDFPELVEAGAHKDFPDFVDTMEMSHERMAASFDTLAGQAIRERNSMIFDRIRSAPRSGGLEDLGAGFGLFQESLDFRQLDPPRPTKVHP